MCELLVNGKSDNTVKGYLYAFKRWERFISQHGYKSLPAALSTNWFSLMPVKINKNTGKRTNIIKIVFLKLLSGNSVAVNRKYHLPI
jgi:hypothetical protein